MLTASSIGHSGLGRMGNQMFSIAGVIGIATRSGQPYGFPRWINYDNPLFGQPADDIEQYLVNELPRVPEGLHWNSVSYFWGHKDLFFPTGNWDIHGHMQSYKFFSNCIDRVRETFRFKDEPEQNDYVAIHYRAGDYIDDPTAQHPRCTKEYYEKAMGEFPESKFILFSDDKNKWYGIMGNATNIIDVVLADSLGVPDYIVDFRIMKRCKSFICANSSFSFMAALLGEHLDKKIVMPKIWFGTSMPSEFNTDDIYPENAIVI